MTFKKIITAVFLIVAINSKAANFDQDVNSRLNRLVECGSSSSQICIDAKLANQSDASKASAFDARKAYFSLSNGLFSGEKSLDKNIQAGVVLVASVDLVMRGTCLSLNGDLIKNKNSETAIRLNLLEIQNGKYVVTNKGRHFIAAVGHLHLLKDGYFCPSEAIFRRESVRMTNVRDVTSYASKIPNMKTPLDRLEILSIDYRLENTFAHQWFVNELGYKEYPQSGNVSGDYLVGWNKGKSEPVVVMFDLEIIGKMQKRGSIKKYLEGLQ
jgi:hypothetical protein